jgi:hypothetical protein
MKERDIGVHGIFVTMDLMEIGWVGVHSRYILFMTGASSGLLSTVLSDKMTEICRIAVVSFSRTLLHGDIQLYFSWNIFVNERILL